VVCLNSGRSGLLVEFFTDWQILAVHSLSLAVEISNTYIINLNPEGHTK